MIGQKRKRIKNTLKKIKKHNNAKLMLLKEKELNNNKSIIEKILIHDNINEEKNENKEILKLNSNNNNINLDKNNEDKLNFNQVKNELKKINNNITENNISILNNIDRLTSVLSSIIIAQNDINNQKNDSEERIFKSEEDSDKNDIFNNPLIIDANNDEKLNYLMTLNDSLKKKINNDIKFDEIYQFFTNFAFQKIENAINILKRNK